MFTLKSRPTKPSATQSRPAGRVEPQLRGTGARTPMANSADMRPVTQPFAHDPMAFGATFDDAPEMGARDAGSVGDENLWWPEAPPNPTPNRGQNWAARGGFDADDRLVPGLTPDAGQSPIRPKDGRAPQASAHTFANSGALALARAGLAARDNHVQTSLNAHIHDAFDSSDTPAHSNPSLTPEPQSGFAKLATRLLPRVTPAPAPQATPQTAPQTAPQATLTADPMPDMMRATSEPPSAPFVLPSAPQSGAVPMPAAPQPKRAPFETPAKAPILPKSQTVSKAVSARLQTRSQNDQRSQTAPLRRDPAPSRMSYRLHRLWLTPMFRFSMRFGVPSLVILAAIGIYFGNEARRDAWTDQVMEWRTAFEQRPEFQVTLMSIEGASGELAVDIRAITALDFPISSFDLDLAEMQSQIAELDAIARADLRILPGGILHVGVVERQPSLVWRSADSLELLDGEGHRVAAISSRTNRPDLPLIAGQGADAYASEALALIKAASPIADRVRGLVRIGERRWDLVLDRDQRVMLPADSPVAALEYVMALHLSKDLLSRDLAAVDMRNPARPTLRLATSEITDVAHVVAKTANPAAQIAQEDRP